MRLCACLTNLHIRFKQLWSADSTFYRSYRNRLIEIGEGQAHKLRHTERRYRDKRRRKRDVTFSAVSSDETVTATPTSSPEK